MSELAVIAEIKEASPSKGFIREDFDVSGSRKATRKAAPLLSRCLRMSRFSRKLPNLELASAAVNLPCLRKDFIIDEYEMKKRVCTAGMPFADCRCSYGGRT